MKFLYFKNKKFYEDLQKCINKRYKKSNLNIQKNVENIIKSVRINGDDALIKFTKKFDNITITKKDILLNYSKIKKNSEIDIKTFRSFKKAIKNISTFHKKQFPKNIDHLQNGVQLKSQWKPIDSVGLYVPGGRAFYPSSLIMNAVPAIIAGVKRIVCVTPPTEKVNPYFISILKELGIKETYMVGGAQAIAALAFGTKTIKPVNKIFGPGNAYVAEAKKQLFGKVGIDLIAGPSEIVVVANKKNKPEWVAADLMAQAEHDENSQSILITDNLIFAKNVVKEINSLKKLISKENIITKSLNNNGIIILVDNINSSPDIINYIAPEHLHIHVESLVKLLPKINNVGGIFLGEYTTEAFGDYIIGTNHILPTSGAAKFSSGLGVLDFMKRYSIVKMNSKSSKLFADDVKRMAELEFLDAHKMSVKIRQKK